MGLVKEPDHSELISTKRGYLYRRTREQLMPLPSPVFNIWWTVVVEKWFWRMSYLNIGICYQKKRP